MVITQDESGREAAAAGDGRSGTQAMSEGRSSEAKPPRGRWMGEVVHEKGGWMTLLHKFYTYTDARMHA